MINVKFVVKDLDDQISILIEFISSDNLTSNYIADFLGLDKNNLGKEVVKTKITNLYVDNVEDLNNAKFRFQEIWDKNSEEINNELTKMFGKEFNIECIAYINLNPVCPRYLNEKSFDVNVNSGDNYLLQTCIHEIIHFIWFDVWKETFPSIPESDYDYPNISWLLSEIAIGSIFKFSNLNKYSENNVAYDIFYVEKIGEKTISEIANDIYLNSIDIKDFQKNLYNFFKNNKETYKLIK